MTFTLKLLQPVCKIQMMDIIFHSCVCNKLSLHNLPFPHSLLLCSYYSHMKILVTPSLSSVYHYVVCTDWIWMLWNSFNLVRHTLILLLMVLPSSLGSLPFSILHPVITSCCWLPFVWCMSVHPLPYHLIKLLSPILRFLHKYVPVACISWLGLTELSWFALLLQNLIILSLLPVSWQTYSVTTWYTIHKSWNKNVLLSNCLLSYYSFVYHVTIIMAFSHNYNHNSLRLKSLHAEFNIQDSMPQNNVPIPSIQFINCAHGTNDGMEQKLNT